MDVKVLFLCGGIGKRMLPFTRDKFFLKFLGKTLLEHQIDLVVKAGLRKVILVYNPDNGEKIKRIAGFYPGISFEYALQERPLGIAHALNCAAPLLGDELIIVNPNDVFEGNAYDILLKARREKMADSYILGCRVDEYFPGGYLVTNERSELEHIVEKPGEGNEPSDVVSLLLHYHTDIKALLDCISRVKSDSDDVYEQALDAMCKNGKRIQVISYSGEVLDDAIDPILDRVLDRVLDTAIDRVIDPVLDRVIDRAIDKVQTLIEDHGGHHGHFQQLVL